MTVWVVTKAWCPNNEPETLEYWDGFQEIVGVYASEDKARKVQEEMICDENTDICIESFTIQ